MAATAYPLPTAEPIRIPALAWLAVALGIVALFVMLQENGTVLTSSWETLHELFHDGRHALGVPCH